MMICPPCRKEMRCIRNGVYCVWGESHAYAGDEYQCPGCGARTIHTADFSFLLGEGHNPEALEAAGRLVRMEDS